MKYEHVRFCTQFLNMNMVILIITKVIKKVENHLTNELLALYIPEFNKILWSRYTKLSKLSFNV
jgi:hypothetical protein